MNTYEIIQDLRKLPNLITLSRILLLFIVIWLINSGSFQLALFSYFWGPISDFLDGWIARRKKLVTDIGKVLDPLADKIFFIPIPFIVGIPQYLKAFWFILLGLEVFLMLIGLAAFLWIYSGKKLSAVSLGANEYGKLKTTSEIVFTVALFMSKFDHTYYFSLTITTALAITFAMMSIAGHLGIIDSINNSKNRA